MASKHHIISPYSPSVNGIIERFCEEQTTDWVTYLPALTFSLNTKIHLSTNLSPYFITYGEHPIFPWTPQDIVTYRESEIADTIRMLQYAQKLCYENDIESKAAVKRAFDIKKKFRQFKIKDKVLLYIPSPPVGQNKKFYTPWRGIYEVIEKTSKLTYIVRKKGGRKRGAHINRLKFYDPQNSINDPEVKITVEDDEPDKEDTLQKEKEEIKNKPDLENMRITRSRTKKLLQETHNQQK